MSISDQEVLDAESRARSEARIKAIREAMMAEREAHQATMAQEADKSRVELEMYLEALTKSEKRLVRLHAFILYMTSDRSDISNPQVAVDLNALRIARYMETGEVK